ncbi:MAG: hypothetical protein HY903_14480 [Deltaproteobacteria bacterium]|nr:hypothetical protein [Deltaproteobacteria bacterium]
MITISSHRAWVPTDAGLAVARLPFIPRGNPAALATIAAQNGFASIGNNIYQHPDGSWVGIINNRIERGVGTVAFSGVPSPQSFQQQPAQPQMNSTPGQAPPTHDSSRPGLPASMRAYAVAQIGIVNASNAATVCAGHGFVQNGGMWIHGDGSWVSIGGGRVSVGWKGYSLQELPYRNGSGWT